MTSTRLLPPWVIYALFFCSGLSSLVYEVIWVRLLTLTFGAAAFAVASVLLAYMGGLCAGSFYFGRIADNHKHSLRLYGILEIFIALYALVLPFVLDKAGSLYVLVYQESEPGFYSLSLIRLLCSTLVLGIPTFCMGGTLPLLAASISVDRGQASKKVAGLYAINTLGAASGCLLAGYLLIPHLGLKGTTVVASCINIGIFLIVCRARQPEGNTIPSEKEAGEAVPKEIRAIVLGTLAISGLCGMAYQTIWTRLLSMVIGTTVYAFTVILAAFLLGIVLGSALYRGWFARQSFLALALSQLGIGLFVLFSMPFFDELPFLFLKIFSATQDQWFFYQSARLLFVLAILLVPTTGFGLCFPLVVEICGGRGRTGRTVGTIYAVNTVGAIVGSFLGGFLLIPFLGLQKSMLILSLLNVLAGSALLLMHPGLRFQAKTLLFGGGLIATLLAVFSLRPWNLHYLNSAPYAYGRDYNMAADIEQLKKTLNSYELQFFKEDATASVSVFNIFGTLSLTIDGKTDASTGGKADMSTQILLAHLPALIAPQAGESLLVGLGSGVSLGSLLRHPVSHVDVLEISPAVVDASHYFRKYNFDPLQDPRVNLIVGDGRHHLLRTRKTYDLVVSQPSNPWITGVANLFTVEYYKLIHQRLSETGVVCQWIPSYHMTQEMLAVILKSFSGVFPYVSLWTSSVPGDLFAIGSKTPMQIRYPQFLRRMAQPDVQQDLTRIDMNNPSILARTFKYGDAQVRDFVQEFAGEYPENSDTYPIVEFMTPRFLLDQKSAGNFSRKEQLAGDLSALLNHMHFEKESNRRLFSEQALQFMNR